MSRSDRAKFKEIVAALIAEGLHTRRGLSVAEYTAICRKAWDECATRPGFERKVLIDPLQPIEGMLSKMPEEYVHWRIGDDIESQRTPDTEITCVAVGAVRPDFSPGSHDGPALPEGEPETPEIRRYILAVFDVLGFSAWLQRVGLREIEAIYERLIDEAVAKETMRSYTYGRISPMEMLPVLGSVPVRHAHFSDTIILWAPLVQHFIAPFIARCADLLCEALRIGVPLRGALSVGKAVLHERTSTFVGAPIVEAAKLEQAQDWIGACLGPSMLAADVAREFDPNLVIPYRVPFKKGRAGLVSGLALDWPRRYLTRFDESPIGALQDLDKSPAHSIYYINAIQFAKFSAGPLFRSDSFRSPNFDSLVASVAEARQSGTKLSRRNDIVLKDLARSGDLGEQIADFLRRAANDADLPPVPKNLPPSVEQCLKTLIKTGKGKTTSIRLVPCVVDVILSRLTGKDVGKDVTDVLTTLDNSADDGPATAAFLRKLAAGERPRISKSMRLGLKSILREALAWAENREVPMGLFESIANECCRAAMKLDDRLSEEALRMLSAVEHTGGKWSTAAIFLRETAQGRRPSVPSDLPEPLNSALQRLAIAAQPAGVQQPRTLEIFEIGFGDPPSGFNLWNMVHVLMMLREHSLAMPEEMEKAISEFEAAASERKVIAECLRAIVTGASVPPPPPPNSLPKAVYVALLQVNALVAGAPIPIVPELVGLAAIHARFASRKPGDCMLLSLFVMCEVGGESATLAEYLLNVSCGGPAGPAPDLQDTALAETAEEVRCLAEPEVGGIGMLFTLAKATESPQVPGSPQQTPHEIAHVEARTHRRRSPGKQSAVPPPKAHGG